MSRDQFKFGLILSCMAGALIGLGMCIAFGVLDVQCSDAAPYWNAEEQRCQTVEVSRVMR
jgi:hypothetical protein